MNDNENKPADGEEPAADGAPAAEASDGTPQADAAADAAPAPAEASNDGGEPTGEAAAVTDEGAAAASSSSDAPGDGANNDVAIEPEAPVAAEPETPVSEEPEPPVAEEPEAPQPVAAAQPPAPQDETADDGADAGGTAGDGSVETAPAEADGADGAPEQADLLLPPLRTGDEDASEPAAEETPTVLAAYEYRFIRVRQNTWDTVEAEILSNGATAVADAGGQLFGIWAGQIGLSANQGIIVTVWPDAVTAKQNGVKAIDGIKDISASETMYLEPTRRPVDPTPPEGPGIFAHRVFEVRRDDAERFIELSDEAWPQFEEVFGSRIFALWRETGHDRANERLILLTRYPDYAAWENSRYWRPEPDPNAADALKRFRERREITVDTFVYTTRLAALPAG